MTAREELQELVIDRMIVDAVHEVGGAGAERHFGLPELGRVDKERQASFANRRSKRHNSRIDLGAVYFLWREEPQLHRLGALRYHPINRGLRLVRWAQLDEGRLTRKIHD